ncbi:MAG: hypothetical protein AABY14_03355, partial [Nanoarchaeota archaeon]
STTKVSPRETFMVSYISEFYEEMPEALPLSISNKKSSEYTRRCQRLCLCVSLKDFLGWR